MIGEKREERDKTLMRMGLLRARLGKRVGFDAVPRAEQAMKANMARVGRRAHGQESRNLLKAMTAMPA